MRKEMFSIYDGVAEVFWQPFTAHNPADARRSFEGAMEREQMSKERKTDYTLYKVADWNDSSGEVTPLKVPLKICSGFDVNASQSEAA